MGEVTLPCFLISLPKAIFVIARLVGPFSEEKSDRDLENAVRALRPQAAFSTLISQFFAIRTDLEPFLSALNWLTSGFVYATLSFNRLTRCLQSYFDILYVSCI